jgi:hypothetical protein
VLVFIQILGVSLVFFALQKLRQRPWCWTHTKHYISSWKHYKSYFTIHLNYVLYFLCWLESICWECIE